MGIAFLLSQLGANASMRFAERIAPLGLVPPEAGVLHHIVRNPGISQQVLAERLGILPSRMVALVDGLEKRGILERRRDEEDRRAYNLNLTAAGQQTLAALGAAVRAHEDALMTGLDEKERARLVELCRKMAEAQGLAPGVHPGYKFMGRSNPHPSPKMSDK
jgi:DNA-binding MarR family transcriptional regulator